MSDATKDDAKSELNKTSVTNYGANIFSTIMVMSSAQFGEDEQNRDDEWNTLFSLRLSMLPASYISAQLA